MKLFIIDHHCPGDTLEDTAVVRDIKNACPDWRINVETTAQELWDNNPNLDRGVTRDNADLCLNVEMPLIHQSNQIQIHVIDAIRDYFQEKLGVKIPAGLRRADLYFTEREKDFDAVKSMVPGWDSTRCHWLITPCGKPDFTTKIWDFARFQEVVDLTSGSIQWIQVGAAEHHHRPLQSVVDMRGMTSHRQLASLMRYADGVVSHISYLMHLATIPMANAPSNRKRPCIVLHGGREPVSFTQYSGHTHLDTIGCLGCCCHGGCWKATVDKDCSHPVRLPSGQTIGRCMDLIKATDVIAAITKHLEGRKDV